MAVLRVDFQSAELMQATTMTVVLPQAVSSQIGLDAEAADGAPPVLYLLHGLSDNDSAWLRFTSIDRYAEALGLAVVMPQVHRSFYTDIPRDGGRYWSFLSDELPALVSQFFRVSTAREDTFVAGLSMGGFGAIKWALVQPDRFAAAASLSGVLDVDAVVAAAERRGLFDSVLAGRTVAEAGNDLMAALSDADPSRTPRMYVGCGTEDGLVAGNRRFLERARAAGLDVTEDLGPGGHEWAYWDAAIQRVLAWLPLR